MVFSCSKFSANCVFPLPLGAATITQDGCLIMTVRKILMKDAGGYTFYKIEHLILDMRFGHLMT